MDYEDTFEEHFDDEKNKYVLFTVDDREYAIHVSYIAEIVSITEITPMPDYPDYARGVIDLRGDTIPIIDFRAILKNGVTEINKNNYCVITDYNEHKYGILVDSVTDIVYFGENGVSNAPKASESYVSNFVMGVARNNDRIVMVLDPAKIFNPAQTDTI